MKTIAVWLSLRKVCTGLLNDLKLITWAARHSADFHRCRCLPPIAFEFSVKREDHRPTALIVSIKFQSPRIVVPLSVLDEWNCAAKLRNQQRLQDQERDRTQ